MSYTLDTGRNILQSLSRVYSNEERIKLNDQDDSEFYAQPRMSHNVDAAFRERLAELYHHHLHQLPAGSKILDLCSSAHSHLPPSLLPTATGGPPRLKLLGHGMNPEELAANPALQSWFLQDLNRRTRLDLPSGSLQAVLCSCSVQYLQWPEEVAAEVLRLLAPGGVFLVSFSSPMWAEKATAGWLTRNVEQRVELVRRFLETAGFQGVASVLDGQVSSRATAPAQPESISATAFSSGQGAPATGGAEAAGPDPFFWVLGYRPAETSQSGPQPPEEMAREYIPPALAELDLTVEGFVSDSTLQRWRAAYGVLALEARELGIPQSAIPGLPEDADAPTVKKHRDHLQDMIASFLSAGL